MAKAVKKTATPARMNSQREGHPQTPQKQDSEGLRINPEDPVHRHAHEWNKGKGSSLGPEKCLLRTGQSLSDGEQTL